MFVCITSLRNPYPLYGIAEYLISKSFPSLLFIIYSIPIIVLESLMQGPIIIEVNADKGMGKVLYGLILLPYLLKEISPNEERTNLHSDSEM